LHAEHLLRAAAQAIDLAVGDHEPARWHFRLDSADYLVESDGHQRSLTAKAPPPPADVTITATTESLTRFIFARPDLARFQTEPPACYRASWQLPGPDLHRQAPMTLRTARFRCYVTASPPALLGAREPRLNLPEILRDLQPVSFRGKPPKAVAPSQFRDSKDYPSPGTQVADLHLSAPSRVT
jgi:hypothetical protein